MKRRTYKIFILAFCLSLIGNYAYCQLDNKEKQRIKKGKFERKAFEKSDADRNKSVGPPGPGGGTGGDPIPISNGLIMLLVGSTVYLSKKVFKEFKDI
ncbi:MAG: hypothetical protein PF517_21075 [Salinivirgaceae bacterium]|jgi:hypothetical protein|nr:hypothetical protein [Salinivirgaceae bacterium]